MLKYFIVLKQSNLQQKQIVALKKFKNIAFIFITLLEKHLGTMICLELFFKTKPKNANWDTRAIFE